jgi:hypothetical protein
MIKAAYILVGVWIAMIGLFLLFGKDWHFRGTKIDFGQGNVFLGWLFIIVGVSIVFIASRIKAKHYKEKMVICSRCEEPFKSVDVPTNHCPKCSGDLEDLSEFYDRRATIEKKRE